MKVKYQIIRTTGQREDYQVDSAGLLAAVREKIGALQMDFVRIGGQKNDTVMAVYQVIQLGNGQRPTRNRKPINPVATSLYHNVCRPGTTDQIVGDVGIFRYRDVMQT